MYLQLSLSSSLPFGLTPNVLLWLKYILANASNVDDHLAVISGFFGYCTLYNLKIHLAKCVMYICKIRWCGHILSEEGIRFEPDVSMVFATCKNQQLVESSNSSSGRCDGCAAPFRR